MENPRKTDRRTLYTINAIKEAFLQLKQNKPFNAISITSLCKEAEISRGTFYLHYNNTGELLDELLDEALAKVSGLLCQLSIVDSDPAVRCTYPLGLYLRENPKLHGLFFDDTLTSYIIKKVASLFKDSYLKEMKERSDLTKDQMEALYYFQLSGCLAVSKRGINLDLESWRSVQGVIDIFVKCGLAAHISKK